MPVPHKPTSKTPLTRWLITLVIAAVAGWAGIDSGIFTRGFDTAAARDNTSVQTQRGNLRDLYEARQSGIWTSVTGTIKRTLADDNEGSRHQRFILEDGSGVTVLVAHNIDLAPRVPLAVHDTIELHGRYEWNDKGGVMHWTHHDPQQREPGGWIEHQGTRYE